MTSVTGAISSSGLNITYSVPATTAGLWPGPT